MSKEIYISSTPHETRLAIVEDEALTEIYYERENEYTLSGSIYNGRVTRVLPGMQSAFVDIGLDRDAFLYITDFMEETPDSEEFETIPNGDRAPRQEDRGGRGRRGRDRDRGRERGQEPQDAQRVGAEAGLGEPAGQLEPSEATGYDRTQAETSEVIGEGAPGADGSRRWRGRRGRRRGRGGPGAAMQSREAAGAFPAEGEASTSSEASETAPEIPEKHSERLGERGEDRGRRDRFDSRREQGGRAPRFPRGFAPSHDLYGVDTGETLDAGQKEHHGEALILPGESLSKYRKPDEEAAAKPVATTPQPTVNLAPPANLYTVAEGWDGGAVLPGERLSRHRNRAPEPHVAQTAGQPEHESGSRSGGRFEAAAANEPAVSQASSATHDADAPEADTAPHAQAEYEPDEASASHRVDSLRSEYRFTAPTVEETSGEEKQIPFSTPASKLAGDTGFGNDNEDTVGNQYLVAEEHRGAAEHAQHGEADTSEVSPAHEFTSLTAAGELLSEPTETSPQESVHHPAPIEVPEQASPIRHEGAVLSTDPEITNTEAVPAEAASHDSAEATHSTTLHASSIEEMEDEEEETLEGAADLGTMLREMSIDHITRHSPDEEMIGEDELEEDELQEADYVEEHEYRVSDGVTPESSAIAEYEVEEEAARTGDTADQEFFQSQFAETEETETTEPEAGVPAPRRDREERRGRGRRDKRGRGDRNGHGAGNRSRHSMQSTNLPAISDLLKPGQEILVQIAKEPIAKKGARITSHIALPGRFLVFMPTVNHTGVSRKIESEAERRRLKEILLSEKGDASGGFIVRTAAEGASEEELRSDLRFLLNLWADIKSRSDSSKSPALIYHDLNLIERILRDQVTDNFSAIWVDTETEYERVLRFLQRFQPSLIRRVKLYTKETPLFEQFGITEEINKALRSKVWLKSGGSIVINQTEALVAIDINTGKYVGKTARLEDTIVKTNLDAIPEIVRQIRLRDLGGIIIIDFIDMDERKNRNRVMAALEDELKKDRAPSKVLQFNDFGLVAITRKRVKQSLERTLSTPCTVCTGTGMVKSPVTVCNDIYIEMRKMQRHLDRGDVMLRVHPEVVKQLKASGARWLQEMEEMVGKTILVKSDPSLHPEQFDIH